MQPAKGAGQQAGSKEWGQIFVTAIFKSSLNASVFAPDALVVGMSPLFYAESTRANYRWFNV